MAILEGTFNTPVGTVPKKAAVLVGAGLALLVGVMYYRGKKQGGAASAAGASTEINPATGYVYGSPEDAAAMAAQGNYQTGGSVGGGGGGGGNGQTGFTTNAQWVQSTITGMTNSGIISDASALSVAIGKYIAGQPVGDNTVARSLIEQAIAFNGPPPLAGPNGYPPSINTQNPVADQPPATVPPPATLPTSATAPAGKNLYDWTNEQGVSFTTVFGNSKNDPNALNPSARNAMTWSGPAGSTLIPTFKSPQTLRIR
jgi:hypothetical protein